MRLPHLFVPAILLLAACGGGGGPSLPATPAPPAPPLPHDRHALGSRSVPGYAIAVRQVGLAVVGQPLTISATITPEPGMAAPVLVEAAVAAEEPTGWTAGIAVADGSWTWTTTLPADLAGQRAWLRISDADGNQSQSGAEDFALVP